MLYYQSVHDNCVIFSCIQLKTFLNCPDSISWAIILFIDQVTNFNVECPVLIGQRSISGSFYSFPWVTKTEFLTSKEQKFDYSTSCLPINCPIGVANGLPPKKAATVSIMRNQMNNTPCKVLQIYRTLSIEFQVNNLYS